jgi:hypothetical protein
MAHEMAVMDATGDSKTIWNKDNPDEVECARDQFNKLTKKGYRAFSVGAKGKQDEIVTEFDPDMEKLIFVPALAGG